MADAGASGQTFAVGDLDLELTGVEVTTEEVVLSLEVVPTAPVLARLAEARRAMDAWAAREGERLSAAGAEHRTLAPPPPGPFEHLNRLDLLLEDDAGEVRRCPSRGVGGTGTEREAFWCFRPGAGPGVRTLRLVVGGVVVLGIDRERAQA